MSNPIQDYFIAPILANGYFNPVNTLVYSLILVVAVLGAYRLMRRMGVRIDRHLVYAILPFIFWGSSTRVLHDAAYLGRLGSEGLNAFYNQPFFPTPGSYLITFTLTIAVLLLCLGIQRLRKLPYWKPMVAIGIALDAVNLALLPVATYVPLLMIVSLTAVCVLAFYAIYRLLPTHGLFLKARGLLSPANQFILGAHLLDAAGTFTAMSLFGYGEQHVVPNLLIPIFGPGVMFALKIAVVLPVLWLIDRYGEKGEFSGFLKVVILILGLAPALRNLLRLVAQV